MMMSFLHRGAVLLATTAFLNGPVFAERLALDFLPPDFPPTDVCRAPAEQVEADETQVSEGGDTYDEEEEIKAWLLYAKRDMRQLQREDADRHFAFINDLISLRAELDPNFSGADEAFARIDLHIDAGRIVEVVEKGLVEALANNSEDLSQSERVRIARYFMTGVGVEVDRARGELMLADEAFKGNANALLELLRLQLAGVELVEWFETPERTATLAFGGKVGQLNRGLCGRAEFIARAYIDGDLLEPNPELAFAWRKFAADQGGQAAAWRVVEHMLNVGATKFSNDDVVHYLRLAVDDAFLVDASDVEAMRVSGATKADRIANYLAQSHGVTAQGGRRSAIPFFELAVSQDEGLSGDSHHLRYLRRITTFEDVPGVIWTKLADEVFLQLGRWEGEAEAKDALEKAVLAGDPAAHVKLARLLLRDGTNGQDGAASEALLLDAVDIYGLASAQRELNSLYRCTRPSLTQTSKADHWSASSRASHAFSVGIEAADYVQLSSRIEPELAAHVHRLAMEGNSVVMAGYLVSLETDPTVSDDTLRYWAARVGRSKKALEMYALFRHRTARNAVEAEEAAEFVRRAEISVGPSMSLDLATVLVDHAGRFPEVAVEVRQLLEESAARGEGAAIRLLHRLSRTNDDSVYQAYADVIEARGDFLALMFAAPFVSDDKFDDYMARAIAEMRCGTKDVTEVADAYVHRGRTDAAMHWMRVGLAIEHGHSMSRLRIDPYRLENFDTPLLTTVEDEALTDVEAMDRAFRRVSVPLTDRFDREAAAKILIDGLTSGSEERALWAYAKFKTAETGIRRTVEREMAPGAVLQTGAEAGDVAAKFGYGLHLRDTAQDTKGLEAAALWLADAAEGGHAEAMVDYAYALAHGVGVPQDRKLALIWLQKADGLLEPRAPAMMRLVRAMDQG